MNVSSNMGLDYSYTQPSQSEEFGGDEAESDSEIEALIRQDQAELSYVNATSQSRTDPGRRYYTCSNVDDGECHVWKWWDETVMEEMRARDRHTLQLAEKVDSLNFLNDYETEQKFGIHKAINN
uniref:Zinc finger GRF-type domain-containing protein n=1 Tax=Brassica oleracea var. oleracea TaxID=109376 RepID=A0A0D3C996_BRAOL